MPRNLVGRHSRAGQGWVETKPKPVLTGCRNRAVPTWASAGLRPDWRLGGGLPGEGMLAGFEPGAGSPAGQSGVGFGPSQAVLRGSLRGSPTLGFESGVAGSLVAGTEGRVGLRPGPHCGAGCWADGRAGAEAWGGLPRCCGGRPAVGARGGLGFGLAHTAVPAASFPPPLSTLGQLCGGWAGCQAGLDVVGQYVIARPGFNRPCQRRCIRAYPAATGLPGMLSGCRCCQRQAAFLALAPPT
jgi:hypothetical protein